MKVNHLWSAAAAGPAIRFCLFGKQGFAFLLAFFLLATSAQATVRYVKTTGSDANTGLSWAQAYASVQSAINVSVYGDEIWVAAGTYKPTLDPFGNATPADPRDRTFYLKNGVKLYGGFAGTETMLSERDWVANLSTLSGDFNGNDVGFTNNGENAYHVVLSVLDGSDTEFDGFTVKGGNANGGGLIGVEGYSIFQFYGGGMENRHAALNVLNCTFKENSGQSGGGANNYAETPTPPTFTNCSFLGNNATLGGGFYSSGKATLINCVFSGNNAPFRSSGGIYNFHGFPTLLNCSFSGNKGAFSNDGTSSATLINCILWGNSTEITNTVNATATVTNSIVQGGYAGTGNLDANPFFVNQPNFNNAPTTAGNLRLTTCSFAMDAGLDAANSTTEDLDGNPRQFEAVAGGQQIDMGAYELQSQPPTISITCPGNFIGGQCGATSVTYPTPTASGNCDAPSLLSGIASGGTFPVGETTVVWKATNNSGQHNTCSFKVTVTGNDTQAPSISCPANQTRSTNPDQCQANVTYPTPTATDNCALAAGSPSLQSGIASGGLFPKGINTVVWRATDQAGLTKTCSFRITVNDTQAPTITCPANQSKTTDPGVCTAVATYANATFTDNCAGGSAVKISGLNSGSAFLKGVNNVVFRATDAAGNQSLCTMTITVTDAQLPTITCPSNIAVTGTTTDGVCSAMVMYASPTATDNCGILSNFLSSGLASGSVFPLGVTTNTWRATDLSGLTANCAFTVTVSCGTNSSSKFEVRSSKLEMPTLEHGHSVNMNLAPNPATTVVIITTEGLDAMGGTLTVFDAQGKMIWQQRSVGEQTRINLDDRWQSGMYLVRLNAGDQVVNKRLVVSRL